MVRAKDAWDKPFQKLRRGRNPVVEAVGAGVEIKLQFGAGINIGPKVRVQNIRRLLQGVGLRRNTQVPEDRDAGVDGVGHRFDMTHT